MHKYHLSNRGLGEYQILLVAVVFCAAALFKITSLLDERYAAALTNRQAWFYGTESLLEIVLAWWLVSGWQRAVAIQLTLVALVGMMIVLLLAIARKETSCHCFGAWQTPPWIILIIDGLMFVMLIRKLQTMAHDKTRDSYNGRSGWRPLATGAAVISLLTLWGWQSLDFGLRPASAITVPGDGQFVFAFKLDRAIGSQFQFPELATNRKQIEDQLSFGTQSVLLVDQDCDQCRQLLKSLLERPTVRGGRYHILELNIPEPLLASQSFNLLIERLTTNGAASSLRLDSKAIIATKIPALVQLSDGVIRDVETDSDRIIQQLTNEHDDEND